MNDYVHYELYTPELIKVEQPEVFHSRILRLQQQISLYGETISSTRLYLQYIKTYSNSDNLKEFVAPKMT